MKKTLISGVVALIAFISSLFPYLRIDAQSQSFMFHIPTFSLYSASADTIQRGEVTYALDSFDPNTCKVTEKSVYHISATEGQTLELSIPFVSSAIDVPDFDVQVNGEAVNGTIRYGEKFVHYSDDFDLNVAFEKISSSELDASIIGTLYIFTPQQDTFTLETKISPNQNVIYQTSNSHTGSENSETFSLTMNNALSLSEYVFFVTNGDFAKISVIGAEYVKETLSCKAFIDRYYAAYKEFYDECGNPPIKFFYSQMDRVLKGQSNYSFDEIFFESFSGFRFNTFQFRICAPFSKFSVTYTLSAQIQVNHLFSPAVYLIEQVRTGNYPIKYHLSLNALYPYLLESHGMIQQKENDYTIAVSEGDFYIVFSSSRNPIDLLAEQKQSEKKFDKINLICFGIIFVLVVACVTSWIIFLKQRKRE